MKKLCVIILTALISNISAKKYTDCQKLNNASYECNGNDGKINVSTPPYTCEPIGKTYSCYNEMVGSHRLW